MLLVRELAATSPTSVTEFLPTVAELASLNGFAHCCHLQASRRPLSGSQLHQMSMSQSLLAPNAIRPCFSHVSKP